MLSGVLSSDMLNKEAQRVVEREESVAAERVRTRGNSIFTAPVFSPLSMVQNDDSDGV